jgi:hypothetical protein
LELLDPLLFQALARIGHQDLSMMRSIGQRGMICVGTAAWKQSHHVLDPVAERQLAGQPHEIDDMIMVGEHLHNFGGYHLAAPHRQEAITLTREGAWAVTVTGGQTQPTLVHLREDRTDMSRKLRSTLGAAALEPTSIYNQTADASPFLPELTRLRRYVTRRRLQETGEA